MTEDYHDGEQGALGHDFRIKLKTDIFDRVMKLTNISLCSFIAPQAEERCICRTRYANLLVWFSNSKVLLIEFGLAIVGCDGEPVFDEKTMNQILNVDLTDISVNGSKTIVGGRPESPNNAKFDFCKVIAQLHWHFWE
jgi:hypothetical protein